VPTRDLLAITDLPERSPPISGQCWCSGGWRGGGAGCNWATNRRSDCRGWERVLRRNQQRTSTHPTRIQQAPGQSVHRKP